MTEGPLPGSFADLILQAADELRRAAERDLSSEAAAHAWPELARMGRHLVHATRPDRLYPELRPEHSQIPPSWIMPRYPGMPVSLSRRPIDPGWAMTGAWSLDALPIPEPVPARLKCIETEARPLLRAAHFFGAAGDLAVTVRQTQDWTDADLVPACRQAQAVLTAAGQIVVRATVDDINHAATTANAGLTVAECSSSLTGHRRMHSEFDHATTCPHGGVTDPDLRELRAAVSHWTKECQRALTPGATTTGAAMIRIASVQQRLMATAAQLYAGLAIKGQAKADQAPAMNPLTTQQLKAAANSWRRPRGLWTHLRVPGQSDPALTAAAARAHAACGSIRSAGDRMATTPAVLTARLIAQTNRDISWQAHHFTVSMLQRGLVLARADQLEARPDRARASALRQWTTLEGDRQGVDLQRAHRRVRDRSLNASVVEMLPHVSTHEPFRTEGPLRRR